ncbi:peptidase C39 family protein [Amycolatopsis magusensis]|uniref:peptidase C39 family protein n=1 Tax=Amycolatopsis magusensis TaxID=882444 RepID=UPI0037BB27C5
MRGRLLLSLLSVGLLATTAAPASAAPPVQDEAIDYHEWASTRDFRAGTLDGVALGPGGLRLTRPIGTVERTEPALGTTRTYEYGRWTSPDYRHGFDATELIASWNALTPAKTWLQVEVKATTATGENTAWYILGQWASGDQDIHRTTVDGQSDAHASVSVDTLVANDGVTLSSYQVRATLYREAGSVATPTVSSLGAMASNVPQRFEVEPTEPGVATGIELAVPRHAQNLHKGKYPEFGGGGQSWCSPTSTAMVTEFWGRRPSAEDMSWLPADYVDPTVAHGARFTYDYSYEGTGNWPFNTAYAASLGLKGHITRLHSLNELESYIAKGIPVITSQSFLAEELDGAGYGTAGHIFVVVGFTAEGDVIVNDPATNSNDTVRNVYKRDQFEKIWQRTKRYTASGNVASGPGGVVYLITPPK